MESAEVPRPEGGLLIDRIKSSTGGARTDLMRQLNAYVLGQAWLPTIHNFAPAR